MLITTIFSLCAAVFFAVMWLSGKKEKTETVSLNTPETDYTAVFREAVMTKKNYIKSCFPDFFVLEQDTENQSGDFYKIVQRGDSVLICCGNSGFSGTEGVSKAVLNAVLVSEILERNPTPQISAGKIAAALTEKYSPSVLTVCVIHSKEKIMQFVGVNSSIHLLRKAYPGTSRKEVDVHEYRSNAENFEVQTISLEKDDKLYLQNGGYNNQNFRELLMKHSHAPMIEQAEIYKNELSGVFMIGAALKIKF